MDKKISDADSKRLMQAIERAKKEREELLRKREAKLWQPIDLPRRLVIALQEFTKDELSNIRRNLSISNISSLSKLQLIDALSRVIPAETIKQVALFDQKRYDLLCRIVSAGGWIKGEKIDREDVEYYRALGLLFTGRYKGQKVLYMTTEVYDAFSELNKNQLTETIKQNTQLLRLTTGLLYYYGVLSNERLFSMLENLIGERPESLYYHQLLASAMLYDVKIDYTDWGYCYVTVEDTDKVYREQQTRKDVEYRAFTMEQLYRAGEADYIDRTAQLQKFLQFLTKNYDISTEELNEIAFDCQDIINNGESPVEIVSYLELHFEFPSEAMVKQLLNHIMELHNNTRQWVLKGHTPVELIPQDKQALLPLARPLPTQMATDNVFDIRTGQKLGRNDPCPCGSGQKHKKCCGK